MVVGRIVSFVVVARPIVDEDRLAVFTEDRQAIFAKQVFAFLRSGRVQFALRPFGSLVALLLHAGDFLLPFLKRCARTRSHSLDSYASAADPKRRPPHFMYWGALPAGLAALARSTTTTTTARTATTAATAEAAATTAAALGFRPSLIDVERTAIEIGSIEGRYRAVRFGGVRHFDERKTA